METKDIPYKPPIPHMNIPKIKLSDEEKQAMGIDPDVEIKTVGDILQQLPDTKTDMEVKAILASDEPIPQKEGRFRDLGVTNEAMFRRNQRVVDLRQRGYTYDTILKVINAESKKEQRGVISTPGALSKIVANAMNNQRPADSDAEYYRYAEREMRLRLYEKMIEEFMRFKDKKMNWKDGDKIDMMTMAVVYEKLGRLQEFYINAQNWNYSMHNPHSVVVNNTQNIFARMDPKKTEWPFKAMGDAYKERLEFLRAQNDAPPAGTKTTTAEEVKEIV